MLYLLRNMPPRLRGQPHNVEAFFRLAAIYRERGGLAGFWTSRRPRRTNELEGGSVYVAVKGETVFRLPFARIERVRDFAPQAHERWLDAWANRLPAGDDAGRSQTRLPAAGVALPRTGGRTGRHRHQSRREQRVGPRRACRCGPSAATSWR